MVQVRALGNGVTTFNSALSHTNWGNWNWVDWPLSTVQAGVPVGVPARPVSAPAAAAPRAEAVFAPVEAPTSLTLEGNVLHWNPVSNATGYVIYVGGVVHSARTVATHFSLSALGLPAGNYNVQVRSLGDGGAIADSGLSVGVAFTSTGSAAAQAAQVSVLGVMNEGPSSWASNSVNIAISKRLVPDNLQERYTQTITRAEFAALAVALYETVTGAQILYGLPFYDTYDINVMKLGAIGVAEGTGRGYFMPDDVITREQMAIMLVRLAEVMGQPLPNADDAIGQLQALGIMGGLGDDIFSADDTHTREQSIVTVLRLFDILR